MKDGIHADGAGLYLSVKGEQRSWMFIYRGVGFGSGAGKRTGHEAPVGRRREMGLGGYLSVSLKAARVRAQAARDLLNDGLDPIDERRREKERIAEAARLSASRAVRTFAIVASEWTKAKEAGWSADVSSRYLAYVKNHCAPIAGVCIADVEASHVAAVLKPIWDTPTGPYVRSFIERVLEFAMANGDREEGLNPARVAKVRHLLHEVKRETEHHAALLWQEVPGLMRRLEGVDGSRAVGALALRFAVLCAARQREVREARWSEIELDKGVWTISAARYKTRREHVVVLSAEAMEILLELARDSNREPEELIFKGRLEGRPLSSHTFEYLLADLGVDVKAHGFRTSFAVWCVEAGGFADDLAQRCLGHVVGTAVTRAYQRSDFFDAKRAAFEAWGRFLTQ